MDEIINVKTIEKFEKEGKRIFSLKTKKGDPLLNITYGEKPSYKEGCEIIINLNVQGEKYG